MADRLPLHNKSGLIAWDGTQWVTVSADSSGYLNVNLVGGSVTISGADGAILDGASAAIKATVRDYANSNPLAVVLTDTSGDAYVASGGAGGGGTEYTEDAASAANPVGGILILRRRDTLSGTEVSADGDNIAANATSKGELYVKHTDSIASTIADGADVNAGAVADASVTGDNTGTLSAKIRGLNKILADVWDSINSRLDVYIQNTSIPVTDNGGSLTVDGTFWQATQPISAASLPLPTGAATAAKQPALGTAGTASADVISVQGIASMTPIQIADNGGSLTVDGTVAATQSGNWSARMQDGAGNALTSATRGAEQALSVQIVDGSGAQIASFGGGTQYTEGDTDASITGTALMFESNTGTSALSVVSNSAPLPISDAGGSITVDGTVTATIAAGASTIAKAEDVAAADADVGVPAMAVRKAAPANTSGTDGDYEMLQMDGGRLWSWAGIKPTYASKATITWTGTSLANGSARESTVVDNTTNRYRDARIRFQTKGQTSGTNYVDVYVYTALGDTTYTDAATGSDAAFTAANRFNSRYLGSIKCNAGTSAVQAEFQLSDIFRTCPDKWGLIVINNSGAALSATAGDHVVEYQGIY